MEKEEFCRQFVSEMVRRAGAVKFQCGTSVEDYATDTAPSYYDEPDTRRYGPVECAAIDMSYWGE